MSLKNVLSEPVMTHVKPQKLFWLHSPTCQYSRVKYHYNTDVAHTTSKKIIFWVHEI